MKPKRPDSAKSHVTKQTQDSQPTKKDLNSSKFSQTFSSGVNSIHERADQFKQYVAQKDKDPRFKHLKPKLQVIQQKTYQPETSKTSFKPFEKKKDKTMDKNSNKKIQQKPQKIEKQEEQLSLSRGFAQKNKVKMNSLKLTMSQQKQQEEKVKEAIRSKIKFDAFKFNKPGEKKQSKKTTNQPKIQQYKTSASDQTNEAKQQKPQNKKKNMKTQEQIKRQNEYRNIERYVEDIQARNIMNFPRNYDQVVNNSSNMNIGDLEKIDLRDFMNEPTQGDYQLLKAKISKMDNQLEVDESVDLQSLIDHKQSTEQLQKEESDNNSQIYASMSASDMKKRNAFITQILAGKISQNEINKLQEMQKTSMRMYKIEREKQDEDAQYTEINMVKRQSNRLMERNRIEAAGQLYRDCDYLSQENQKRIQELLNGDIGPSPFQSDQLEGMKRRRIDEGIRMYRQMSGSQEVSNQILNEQTLPRDPKLRKEAEDKVLKERVSNINTRIAETGKIVVTKAKIQTLIKKFAHTRKSSNYEQIHQQNQQRFEEQMKTLAEAESMLKGLSNRQDVDEIIGQIQMKYKQLQQEIRRYNQLDEKELIRMEKQRLKSKMREIEKVERLSQECESQIGEIQNIKRDIEEKLKAYDELQEVRLPQMNCDGYKPQQTLEDIDAIITKKWKSGQYSHDQIQQN